MQQTKNQLALRLDPNLYSEKVGQILEGVSKGEREAWYLHPCTQALKNQLEGDLVTTILVWLGSGGDESSADLAAMRQSFLRGRCFTIDHLSNTLEYLRNGEEDGADTSGSPDSD